MQHLEGEGVRGEVGAAERKRCGAEARARTPCSEPQPHSARLRTSDFGLQSSELRAQSSEAGVQRPASQFERPTTSLNGRLPSPWVRLACPGHPLLPRALTIARESTAPAIGGSLRPSPLLHHRASELHRRSGVHSDPHRCRTTCCPGRLHHDAGPNRRPDWTPTLTAAPRAAPAAAGATRRWVAIVGGNHRSRPR